MSFNNRSRSDPAHGQKQCSQTALSAFAAKEAAPTFVDFYRRSLKERPRLTNALVSMLISVSADVFAQSLEHRHSNDWRVFDLHRTWALALTSFIYNGFILTPWLRFLNDAIPGNSTKAALQKLALTQAVVQPLVYVPFFFIFHGLLMGQAMSAILHHFTQDYCHLLVRLWSLFMPTRLMMFLVVPPQYQVLWDTSVSFIWQLVLSLWEADHAKKGVSFMQVRFVSDMAPFGRLDLASAVMVHVHSGTSFRGL